MSLQIIIQQIRVFGKLLPHYDASKSQQIQQFRRFRMCLGNQTFISPSYGYFISPSELMFQQSFSFKYDNHSFCLQAEIFKEHEMFDNSDLFEILTAEFDLTDLGNTDRLETNLVNFKNQAIGKLTLVIEVFRQGPQFTQKVSNKILFEVVKQQKQKQVKASVASRNIKNLMVNNRLTNTLMTISYLQVKPQQQDTQTFNRECFIMVRYGVSYKAYTRVTKVLAKQSVQWTQFLIQFMQNQDVKYQFFYLYYDDLGSLQCKAKGQIKYVVFDQTINNHIITLFDRKSNVYGQLLVKFAQKEVEQVNINNKVDKKLKDSQATISLAIQNFNRYKFESQNNNRILSQKLRELQLKKLKQIQEKSKPLDPQQKKKREQHGKFIQFLQKEVIKIERQLKKRQVEQKRDERKHIYASHVERQKSRVGTSNKSKKFNSSMSETEFRQNLPPTIEEIDQEQIIAQQLEQQI